MSVQEKKKEGRLSSLPDGKYSFILRSNLSNLIPNEIRSDIKEKVGSYSLPNGRDGHGLTIEEQKHYLPMILAADPSDKDWNQRCSEFWSDYSIIVNGGDEIEINFTIEKDRVLNEDVTNYMRFNFAKSSPIVAFHDDELDNPSLYVFSLIDANKEKRRQMEIMGIKDQADTIYATIISKIGSDTPEKAIEKMNHMVEMMDTMIPSLVPREEVQFRLRQLKETKPQEFVNTAQDKDIELKILIKRGLRSGEITETGGVYYIQEQRIGNIQITLEYLKDATNGVAISKLKDSINKVNSTL